jgi:hypothetical protein
VTVLRTFFGLSRCLDWLAAASVSERCSVSILRA